MEHMKALEAAHRPDPTTPEPDAVSKQTQNDGSPLPAEPIAPTSQSASPLPTNLKPRPPGQVDTPSKECASATQTTCSNPARQASSTNLYCVRCLMKQPISDCTNKLGHHAVLGVCLAGLGRMSSACASQALDLDTCQFFPLGTKRKMA